jgi:murein DD-endopeptidase MepM/ murein hydrolase activator NlpD
MPAKEISDLLTEFENILSTKPESKSTSPTTHPEHLNPNPEKRDLLHDQTFQSPISGGWKNLGGFTTTPYMVGKIQKKNHMGLDMGSGVGTPIFPIGDGVVTNVMTEATNALGGNSINIKHPSGVSSYYAHMNSVNVKVGDHVTKATQIGTVGNTGNAKHTAPHLHIEVSNNGSKVDPLSYFGKKAAEHVSEIEKRANAFYELAIKSNV